MYVLNTEVFGFFFKLEYESFEEAIYQGWGQLHV